MVENNDLTEYFLKDELPKASWWSRVFASLIDVIIVMTLNVAVGAIFSLKLYPQEFSAIEMQRWGESFKEPSTQLILSVTSMIYIFCFELSKFAATPGKIILGIKVCDLEGNNPNLMNVLLRWLVKSISSLVQLAGLELLGSLLGLFTFLDSLWPLWDDKSRTVHDIIAKTYVIKNTHKS